MLLSCRDSENSSYACSGRVSPCFVIVIVVLSPPDELDSPLLQKLYVGLTAMALVSILLMWFWPSSDEEPSADSLHEDAADEEADEEPGLLTIIIGNLVLCGPLLATVVLGALKSYGLAQQLGWMS